MIKKILSTFLVSSALIVFFATGSMADRPTFAVGASVAYGGYVASGQELEGFTTQEKNEDEESGEFGYTSLFLEVSFADRLTVGASWMMDSVETAMSERTDVVENYNLICGTDAKKSAASIALNADECGNAGTSTAKAEFSNLITAYAELNLYNGLYVKYGIMEMDVDTKESLHTDTSYPNATMDGYTYGFGWKGSFDNGVYIKTETLLQDWSTLTIEGEGSTDNDNKTQISADLSGAVAQISIGRAF
jgi:hypothetical protein